MTKKIHTIQSSDKKEFDRIINQHLEQGWDLVEGSYSVFEGDVYSQIVIFNKSGFNHFEFYDNELIKQKGNYKNGNKDGLWTFWYENGQKEAEGTYKNGKKDGFWRFWDKNGQNTSEGTYKDGIEDGFWYFWDKNGQKNWEETRSWYKNGQKTSEGTYKDGKPDGLYTMWYDNGQKWLETTYKDGKGISSKRWNEDGSVKE